MCLVSLLQALTMAHYFMRGYRAGMHLRSAVIMLVYQKCLKLVPGFTENKDGGQGNVANAFGTRLQ